MSSLRTVLSSFEGSFLLLKTAQVNQVYNEQHQFAGDRVWSAPYGQEVWAKPLVNDSVAVSVHLPLHIIGSHNVLHARPV